MAGAVLSGFCREITQHQNYLSTNSTILCGEKLVRWSDYGAPEPAAIITVGSEEDISKIVKLANTFNVSFLVQSGGNGWADTFSRRPGGIVIDVSRLKAISFNEAKTEVTFQTGVLIEEIVAAAWENDARVATGTCNCISALGAGLGGGIGRGTGLYGLGLDQLIAVNLVDAQGRSSTVTAKSDPDLWWALKGAGPNFGIVTSVVYRSYPIAQANNTAWSGLLYYHDSQIEAVVTTIDQLELEPEMQLDFYFTQGVVAVLPFYLGSREEGRAKFAPLLELEPFLDQTEVIPYNTWNSAGDSFCTKGGRKPTYTTNLKAMDPLAWRDVWNQYIDFYNKYAEANQTTILTECYSTAKNLEIGNAEASYPWRDIKCYSMVIPWYTSESLDPAANAFGQNVRASLSPSPGTFSAYINFAHGDESLRSIYGASLARLQKLKRKYDPRGRFNQWFSLS
ncbi:FAD binding domain-containing protein [Diaporthe helianthi]|uniref:FAD binding domain-containing protein n=1 Tax=Diaporthe helianthi TaxID=158607 RepID=A0A2P5HIQ0_DIAHE|nr:FAD binding domain-containing protein [Diaporthe helianthi]